MTQLPQPGGSHLLTGLLEPAVKLWLRSQVSAVASLSLKLEAGDRQLLTGRLPHLEVAATGAVYQGLHLSQIALTAEQIAVNLGQVLRGKPLHLLNPVAARVALTLTATDLARSLAAPLLAGAISDLLRPFQTAAGLADRLETPTARLRQGGLELCGQMAGQALSLITQVELRSPQAITLGQPRWVDADQQVIQTLDDQAIDLGPETHLETLEITPQQLVCQGVITIAP